MQSQGEETLDSQNKVTTKRTSWVFTVVLGFVIAIEVLLFVLSGDIKSEPKVDPIEQKLDLLIEEVHLLRQELNY